MADLCDRAQPAIEAELERHLAAHRSMPIPEGRPGECDLCGVQSLRLVDGCCARCRDAHRLN